MRLGGGEINRRPTIRVHHFKFSPIFLKCFLEFPESSKTRVVKLIGAPPPPPLPPRHHFPPIIPSFTITVANFYFSTFTSASTRMYNYPLISRLLPRGAPSNSAELSDLASGSKLPIDLIRAGAALLEARPPLAEGGCQTQACLAEIINHRAVELCSMGRRPSTLWLYSSRVYLVY